MVDVRSIDKFRNCMAKMDSSWGKHKILSHTLKPVTYQAVIIYMAADYLMDRNRLIAQNVS